MLTLSRFIGNKADLVEPILSAIAARAEPGDLVCDIFSGTLAVSLALKRSGYRVASNDINLFSAIYGQAFLTNGGIPAVEIGSLVPSSMTNELAATSAALVSSKITEPGYAFLSDAALKRRYERFCSLLVYLGSMTDRDLPPGDRRSDIFDVYSRDGRLSGVTSSRGWQGRRNFFSTSNAQRIDLILNQLRRWNRLGLLSGELLAMLLAVLLTSVEKISNTQGTYHDFPRDMVDPRALRPIRLIPPALDGLLGPSDGNLLGIERDSLEFVREVPEHQVLYVDPPYNFRQYTAYYFLPNVLARYPNIEDLDDYFGSVRYVRGQNPADDFVSTFSKRRLFVDSLRQLIAHAHARWVVLSYFNGRNHWGTFKSDGDTIGLAKLVELFESEMFRPGTLEVIPIARVNYQSYGGHQAKKIDEYLIAAQKA